MRTMAQQEKHATKHAELWNRQYPPGTKVRFYPALRGKEFRETETTSEASVLSGHTAVVSLKGETGCCAIANCEPC